MSVVDKQKMTTELRRFGQRKLVPGEVVLLSYCLANALPIFEKGETSVGMVMVQHHALIENVLYRLGEWCGTEKDALVTIKQDVTWFLMWRSAIAHGDSVPLFSGNSGVVIDELSLMVRFIDAGTLCTIGDVAQNANWLVGVFRDLVTFEKDALFTSKVGSTDGA